MILMKENGAIAFSDDNINFATSTGIQDANHTTPVPGIFAGPTLWSSDLNVFAMPSGGNGSHLDMLHQSPNSMGIAHEADNIFWVYDGYNQNIVQYNFTSVNLHQNTVPYQTIFIFILSNG